LLGKLRYQRQEARQRVWYRSPWEPERHLCDVERASAAALSRGDSPWKLYGPDGSHLINGNTRDEAVNAFLQYAGDNCHGVAASTWRTMRSAWLAHTRYSSVPNVENLPTAYLDQLYDYLEPRLKWCQRYMPRTEFHDILRYRGTGRTVALTGSVLSVEDRQAFLRLDNAGFPNIQANVDLFENPGEGTFLVGQLNAALMGLHAATMFPAPFRFPEPFNPYPPSPRF
jgi:hypothetical protein